MKEIVVLSGKGGTGKTSLTASFALLAGSSAVVADCDVDASDMHLLLAPVAEREEMFYSGKEAVIDNEACISCNRCLEVCHFDAVETDGTLYEINSVNCEGCSYCERVCPVDAITMKPSLAGDWYVSKIRSGARMVHARLGIGAENSGKLVARVKNEAKDIASKDSKALVLVDGSPGIGCPVVSSLSGANYIVIVTEPTISGLHDLKRLRELIVKFRLPSGCIINKADLNSGYTDEIQKYLKHEKMDMLGTLPYDEKITSAMVQGKSILEEPYSDSETAGIIREIWQNIQFKLGLDGE
ncbi:MAG: (4Fe-4S)-binding protein [Spirochaetes bacterium]|nr:MAG: (4Fe-4S)-binding protein [Spirochaetota bacterium]